MKSESVFVFRISLEMERKISFWQQKITKICLFRGKELISVGSNEKSRKSTENFH